MLRQCFADDSCILVSPAAMVVALGGLGGIFYWMTIFPVDAVKSAMQTDDLRKPQRKFPTMASAVKVIPLKSVRPQLRSEAQIILACCGTLTYSLVQRLLVKCSLDT